MAIHKEATVKAVLLRAKLNVRNEAPVNVRVYYPGFNNRHYATGIFYKEERWNGHDTNVDPLVAKAIDVIDRLRLNGHPFSWSAFETQFLERSGNASIDKFIDDILPNLNTEGTKQTYRDLKARLRKYAKNKPLYFSDVTPNMISSFIKHLSTTNNTNSVNIYLRTFSAVFGKARGDGIVPKDYYPFKGRKIASVRSKNKRYLTKGEANKLFKSQYNPHDERCMWVDSKNYFFASYFACGMNAMDLFRLKWVDVVKGEIHTDRIKTGNPLHIVISPELKKIFDHYKTNDSKPNDYIFPVNNDVDLTDTVKADRIHNNILRVTVKNMRKLAIQEKIDTSNLDFYSARHTFAVHYLQYEKSPSIYTLMRYMGHSSEKSTRAYIESLMGTGEVEPITFYEQIAI